MRIDYEDFELPEPTVVYEGTGPVQKAAPPVKELDKAPEGRGKQHMRRIYVAELDETFESVQAAADAMGTGRSSLATALSRGHHTMGGYTFRYAD